MSGLLAKIELEVQVPPTFPEKYIPALVRVAELCAVKKHFENPPRFEIFTQGSNRNQYNKKGDLKVVITKKAAIFASNLG